MTATQLATKIINSFIHKLLRLGVKIEINEQKKLESILEIAKDIESYAKKYNDQDLCTPNLTKLINLKNPKK